MARQRTKIPINKANGKQVVVDPAIAQMNSAFGLTVELPLSMRLYRALGDVRANLNKVAKQANQYIPPTPLGATLETFVRYAVANVGDQLLTPSDSVIGKVILISPQCQEMMTRLQKSYADVGVFLTVQQVAEAFGQAGLYFVGYTQNWPGILVPAQQISLDAFVSGIPPKGIS